MTEQTDLTGVWVDLEPGLRRCVKSHCPEAMVVEVSFQAGVEGAPHQHPHVQTIFVKEGRFVFTVDGKEVEVSEGDGLVIPPNTMHGCVAQTAGTLIDSFSPRRDDFL